MVFKLTFKKAFGIEMLPYDRSLWMMELHQGQYDLTLDGHQVKVSTGTFGVDDREKSAISVFTSSSDYDLKSIPALPTIDVSILNPHIEMSEPINPKRLPSPIDHEFLEPFVHIAFKAINRFIDSCRVVKYLFGRDTKTWPNDLSLVPLMTEREFRTYLFYTLEAGDQAFVGSIKQNQDTPVVTFSVPNIEYQQKLQEALKEDIPLQQQLIMRAWEYFILEDFKSAIVYSCTVIEMALKTTLRRILSSKSIASSTKITKFVDETSNRLLCTVILGLLDIGDRALRDSVASTFDIRNGVIHGGRKIVTREQAKAALDGMEAILNLLKEEAPI